MSWVTLAFLGMDPGQGLNEDNICTKLLGNPSMHK